MKKIEEQDEIINKIQRKIDKDIERMKSKKDMDKSVEKQIRNQLLDLYLFQSENDKKLEKQRKTKADWNLNKNVENNAKKQQKTDKKQRKNSEILSKNQTQYNISVEQEQAKDYYSLNDWKSLSQTLRNQKPKCELCGAKSQDVHHVFPFMHQSPELRKTVFLDKDNLLCLCEKCHYAIHHNKLLPEQKYKLERLKSSISQKYLDLGLILSWL